MKKILISNDDGYFAPGIQSLNKLLSQDFETLVIAPDRERSSCGHGISLMDPIRLKEVEKNVLACNGLPADCILVGLGALMKDDKPDFVVSGINHGANLGQDRFYSGTMAAAREGTFRNIRSIAVSLVTKIGDKETYFDTAAHYIRKFLLSDVAKMIPKNCLVNVNVPNRAVEKISGVKLSDPGFQDYSEEVLVREDARARSYYWLGGTYRGHIPIEGSDCDHVEEGFVAFDLQDLSGRRELTDQMRSEFDLALQKIDWS